MAVIDKTLINSDYNFMVNDLPVSVTVGGQTVNGRKSQLRRSEILVDQGLVDQYTFSVYIQLDDVTSEPDIDDTLTISGITYRILEKAIDNTDQLVRLDLGEEFSNA